MRCLNNLSQPLVVQSSTHSRVCNLQFLMSVAGHNFYFAQRQVNINSAPLSPVLGGVLQTLPLTARLISISSKSLWSSMAATSQRYSAVSDRVVLKIRMLAGSLSWALFSKSPFLRKEGERGGERGTLTIALSHTQRVRKTTLAAKVIQGSFHCLSSQFVLQWL